MKIEIWSDIMCPFCYIGKRKFEKALETFEHKDKVEITWKSFQLAPDLEYQEGDNLTSYLARHKGWTEEYARGANAHVSNLASQEGLTFNLDKAIPANTLKAHRLIHLAEKYKLQDKAEERLFTAYFTEGKNVGDTATLTHLGKEIGLPENELLDLFSGDTYTNDVHQDIMEAQQIGVRGVPFFVLDRKYAISGAQGTDVFQQALEKAWNDEAAKTLAGGESCGIDGEC